MGGAWLWEGREVRGCGKDDATRCVGVGGAWLWEGWQVRGSGNDHAVGAYWEGKRGDPPHADRVNQQGRDLIVMVRGWGEDDAQAAGPPPPPLTGAGAGRGGKRRRWE